MVLSISFRLPHWGISFIAGITAAFAFLAAGNGGILSFLLANFSPLPLMIATLGWSGSSGLVATFISGIIIYALSEARSALEFVALVGLPAVGLAMLALLRSNGDRFYPLGRLLAWIGWVSIFTTMIEIAVWSAHNGGYDAASTELAQEFLPILKELLGSSLKLPDTLQAEDIALFFARAVPFVSVVMTTILLVLNLWLAGRTVQISGRLERKFPSLPEETVLPQHVLLVFAAGFALIGVAIEIASPSLALAGGMIVAGVAALYALQGLAVLHATTRNLPFRGGLLALAYFGILFLSLWPLIIAAFVGLADSLVSFRRESPVGENL